MAYTDYQAKLSPTALLSPYGRAFVRALAIAKDYYAWVARRGVLARFPDYAPPDGLAAIGDERGIDRGNDPQLSPPETDAAYAARLIDAWNIWLKGGTAWGLLLALAAQGYATATIIQQNGLKFALSGSDLVITPWPQLQFSTRRRLWGQGVWGGGQWGSFTPWNTYLLYFPSPPSSWTSIINPPTAASRPSIGELQKLRAVVERWQPAVAKCVGIGVVTGSSPGFWGGGVWGSPGTWGGNVVWFSAENRAQWTWPFGQEWGASNVPGKWGASV